MRTAPGQRDERGVTLIFVAVCMVGLLALVGLVIDGGNAYAQRRQMQNAADSAALAGANALQRYRQGVSGATADKVLVDARSAAGGNGARMDGTFTCSLVRLSAAGAEIGTTPCPAAAAGSIPADAYGVRVGTGSDHQTSFMKVVGVDAFSARGAAAALLRKAAPSVAPFMVCANAAGHPVPLLIVSDPLHPETATINPAAVGQTFTIYGNDVRSGGRDCGNPSSSFRGLVDLDLAPFDVPGWWDADQGNKGGHMVPNLAGGCGLESEAKIKDTPVGCEFALPLCLSGNDLPGNGFQMYCVTTGRFRITDNKAPKSIDATFLGGGVATGGPGGGVPSAQDVVVIKLSE